MNSALGGGQKLAADALPAHGLVHGQIFQPRIAVGQNAAELRRPARVADQRKADNCAAALRQQEIRVVGTDGLADLVFLRGLSQKNSGCIATKALSSWRYSARMAGISASAAGRITVFAAILSSPSPTCV